MPMYLIGIEILLDAFLAPRLGRKVKYSRDPTTKGVSPLHERKIFVEILVIHFNSLHSLGALSWWGVTPFMVQGGAHGGEGCAMIRVGVPQISYSKYQYLCTI